MTIEAYMNPDFTWLQKFLFLGMAILGLTICLILELIVKLPKYREEFDDEETLDFD